MSNLRLANKKQTIGKNIISEKRAPVEIVDGSVAILVKIFAVRFRI